MCAPTCGSHDFAQIDAGVWVTISDMHHSMLVYDHVHLCLLWRNVAALMLLARARS